ncbi:MAG TPA: outer membrane beta-barrel protein [Methylocystis sp.]|nr:outer membrane beta-barrel protein [Methylocystis sp.]
MFRLTNSLGVALAAALVAPAAWAADLPFRKAPLESPPIFSWTGFYLGYNSGFGGGVLDANAPLITPGLAAQTTISNRANGGVFGGEVGYQIQFPNNVVLGLETDMQWSGIRASAQTVNYASVGLPGYIYQDFHNSLDWFGTTRLRAGYSFGRLLPYITGGVAYGQTSANGEQIVLGGGFSGDGSRTAAGWAAGAGLDYALSANLSARAEYIYVQLANASGPAVGFAPGFPPLFGSFSTGSFGAHIIRTGLNWKFDRFAFPQTGDLLGMFTDPSVVDWTGFYAGVNGGYGGEALSSNLYLASTLPLASFAQTQNRSSGFLFGGQAGYNRQLSNHLVVGLETDMQWSGVRVSDQVASFPGPFTTDLANGFDWLGTTRARVGWASGSSLAYATGGVAYGDVIAHGAQATGGLFWGATTQTNVGWTAGGGAEYALDPNLSLKAEYLYVDLGGVRGQIHGVFPPISPVVGYFSTGSLISHVTRFGVNWRFSAPASAIVAKY